MRYLTEALANLTGDTQIQDLLITADGGIAEKYVNRTGHASVKGEVVKFSLSTEGEVVLVTADGPDHIGVVYEAGVAEGSEMWVVVRGDAYVLMEDTTAATKGYWAKVSDSADGRVDASNAAPQGGTVNALNDHFTEIGHCREDVTAGTNKLCLIHLHFN